MRCHRERIHFSFIFFTKSILAFFVVFTFLITQNELICFASPTESVAKSDSSFIPTSPHPPSTPQDSIKTIKTPSGTVKCHCQTISSDSSESGTSEISPNNGKTIEIEIYKPEESDQAEDRLLPILKNSFNADMSEDEDAIIKEENNEQNFQERVFSTEPTTFYSASASPLQQTESHSASLQSGSGNVEDDFTTLQSSMHANNHRHEPFESVNAEATIYKAFRSAELTDRVAMSLGSGEGSSEAMHNKNHDYLLDFGKNKKEFLYLGDIVGPFKGPRKRRRRALRGSDTANKRSSVVYVYPVGQPNPEEKQVEEAMAILQAPVGSSGPERIYPVPVATGVAFGNKNVVKRRMEEAMNDAWQQYGTKGISAPPLPLPPVPIHTPHQFHPRPFLHIDRIFNPFQPMTSEWDKRVSVLPPPVPDRASLEPGIFSQILARYIDFEVNNHEAADLMRKVVFGVFIGFIIIGWVLLGAALGLIPLKKWLAIEGSSIKRIDKGKDFIRRDSLSELSEKILLSLDADWLKRLEERVMGNEGIGVANGKKMPTQAFCCILPDQHTKGMVECQVSKQGNKSKVSAFKCISDLIYNFQFGPKEDSASEEQDNIVNLKSKANNNGRDTVSKISGNDRISESKNI